MSGSLDKIRKGVSKFTSRCCCCRSSSVHVDQGNTNSKSKSSKTASLKSKSLLSVCRKNSTGSTPSGPARKSPPSEKTCSSRHCSVKTPSPKKVKARGDSDYSSLSSWSSSSYASSSARSPGEVRVATLKNVVPRSPSQQSLEVPSYIAEFEAYEALIKSKSLSMMERYRRTPLTNLIGRENQWSVQGKYSGSQCTVMALTAAAYQYIRPMAYWNKDIIDKVVWAGDYHHTQFRDSLQFSTNKDQRIALDELPSTIRMSFGESHEASPSLMAYVGEHSGLLFLKNTQLTKTFARPTLKEYIESKAAGLTDAAFVVTINDYSHSIIKENNHWYLYDSHGNMRVPTPIFGHIEGEHCLGNGIRTGATLSRFDTLSTLIGVLQQNQPAGSPCEARLVTVIPTLTLDFDEKKKPVPTRSVPQNATYRVNTPVQGSTARLVSNTDTADVDPEDIIQLD